MNTFESIKIRGFDETRPPRVRKEAYIDLYFELSCQAPEDWCEDFNILGRRISPAAKIDKNSRLIIDTYAKIDKNSRLTIDTYVNDMNNIAAHLAALKLTVDECNQQYAEKLRQRELALAAENAALAGGGGAQQKLNAIVAALEFDN